ncbi:MAG: NADH-quinone oxidoreductase subunit B [Candidatus Firestonebacteria bacterium]|nr:NADH-quinone oxidoreductase subunit B [Candidatus Firestonebacteria bacterium]
MGLESKEGSIITTNLDKLFNWARCGSFWPVTFGLACCAIEMMSTGASRYDLDRFGIIFRSTPRQADAIIVAGTVTKKMAGAMKRVYEQIPEPRYAIAMGSCSISGGVFNTYSVVQGADLIIPIDIYVPGCPPRPEALMYGIIKLKEKISKEGFFTKGNPIIID